MPVRAPHEQSEQRVHPPRDEAQERQAHCATLSPTSFFLGRQMKNFTKDILGQRFGRLTVTARLKNDKHNNAVWKCLCDCGKETTCIGFKLRQKRVSSCGCLLVDSAKARFTTHGLSESRLFKIWTGIKTRCTNSKRNGWHNYGGRGIALCAEWQTFGIFSEWALATGYNDALTIDRINPDEDYAPNNCRWVTKAEQAKNRRICLLPNGETKANAASRLGISVPALSLRIKKWGFERAITQKRRSY